MNPYDPTSQTSDPAVTERVSTTKTRRYLVAAALLGGGLTLGAVFSPIGLADAQSDDTTSTTEPADGSGSTTTAPADADATRDGSGENGRGGHGHRGHGRGAHLEDLAGVLGLEVDELRDQLAAGSTLAEIAEAQGVDTEALVDAMVTAATERLDEAVADGRLDQEDADAKLAEVEERFRDSLDEQFPGPGDGRMMGGLKGLRDGINEVAESLGLDLDALRQSLQDGQTVAEAAEAQGVTAEALTQALIDEANERIDEAVAEGRIDEERAAELRDQLAERVEALVNGSLAEGFGGPGGFDHGGFGHHGPGRGHGMPGRGGPGDGAEADQNDDAPSSDGAGETQESSFTA